MIRFVPPHNEKLRAKAGELLRQAGVVLGKVADAIPIEAKKVARRPLPPEGARRDANRQNFVGTPMALAADGAKAEPLGRTRLA